MLYDEYMTVPEPPRGAGQFFAPFLHRQRRGGVENGDPTWSGTPVFKAIKNFL